MTTFGEYVANPYKYRYRNYFVVYQTPGGHFGYRGIPVELGKTESDRSSEMLMSSMVANGETIQCWATEADTGSRAITQVRRLLRSQAIKS